MASEAFKFNFTGRKVLVTGGASGIGKATAKAFLNLGASVIVVDVNQRGLDVLTSEHSEITTICADIADWSGLEMALASHHPIHHLVNNAGISEFVTPLSTVTEEQFDKIMNVNFKAVVRMSQLVSRGMIEAKLDGATIVNLSSVANGKSLSLPDCMVYAASKAAVSAVTRTMAHELAPHKIRVNAIRPGAVKTEIYNHMTPAAMKETMGPFLNRQVYHQDFMQPHHIANTVVYLSSPASEMITGIGVTVDAGYELS